MLSFTRGRIEVAIKLWVIVGKGVLRYKSKASLWWRTLERNPFGSLKDDSRAPRSCDEALNVTASGARLFY